MNLITVLGPTAGGKTPFAANLAYTLDTEIISADSRQVYQGMDLGSGKDLAEYTINGRQIRHHLVDILPAGQKYNVFRFQKDFFDVFTDCGVRGKIPIMCGGTGLYIESIVRNYQLVDVPANPALRARLEKLPLGELRDMLASMKTLHNTTDTDTKKRAIRGIEIEAFVRDNPMIVPKYPKISSLIFGIKNPRPLEREKIRRRLMERLDCGMVDEIRGLLASGISEDDLTYYGLEYKYVTLHAVGKLGFGEMAEQLFVAICQFAKRQMTWFRRMERMGARIYWIDGQLPMERKIRFAQEIISRNM